MPTSTVSFWFRSRNVVDALHYRSRRFPFDTEGLELQWGCTWKTRYRTMRAIQCDEYKPWVNQLPSVILTCHWVGPNWPPLTHRMVGSEANSFWCLVWFTRRADQRRFSGKLSVNHVSLRIQRQRLSTSTSNEYFCIKHYCLNTYPRGHRIQKTITRIVA